MATNPLITVGTSPPVNIDLGKDEPEMTLQYRDGRVLVDVVEDGEVT